VLPLSVPGLATVALFTSLSYWNDFYTPMLLLREKVDTFQNLQYMIYRALMNTQMLNMIQQKMAGTAFAVEVPNETFRMAMAIVTIGPIIFAYPFFQKYFIKGLTIGAIKG
jgi:putative aldouronate transport system permease protein